WRSFLFSTGDGFTAILRCALCGRAGICIGKAEAFFTSMTVRVDDPISNGVVALRHTFTCWDGELIAFYRHFAVLPLVSLFISNTNQIRQTLSVERLTRKLQSDLSWRCL